MSKTISKRVSRNQLEKIADFMEKNPQLFQGNVHKDFEKKHKEQLWRELVDVLNAEDGPKRDVRKWQKSFKDYKCYVKKKYLSYLADSSALCTLSHFDVRFLAMMGYVVDLGGMDHTPTGDVQAFILQEIKTDVVEDGYQQPENNEQNQRFYHAPEIVILQQQNVNSTPTLTQVCPGMAPNKENSTNVEETSNNKNSKAIEQTIDNKNSKTAEETFNNKNSKTIEETFNNENSNAEETSDDEEMQGIEGSPHNEESLLDVKSLLDEEYLLNEEWKCSEISPAKKSTGKKSKLKNKSSIKKKRGGNSKTATAAALHAIAKELNMKNELTKMKIQLGKERLILEKRKIEAFELIAKRLHRK